MNESRKLSLEKISEDDQRVAKAREDSYSQAEFSNESFGKWGLDMYEEHRQYLQMIHDGRSDEVPWDAKYLEEEMKKSISGVKKIMEARMSYGGIKGLGVREIIYNYALAALEKGEKGILPYFTKQEDGSYSINIQDMPDELVADILRFHSEKTKEAREKAEKDFKKWSSDFINCCKEAIADGWLPLSEKIIKERVEQAKIILRDSADSENSAGDLYRWVVTIIPDFEIVDPKDTLFHELVHTIAGREMAERRVKVQREGEEPYEHSKVLFHKSGLKYSYGYAKGIEVPGVISISGKFRWLDEGLTEMISMRLQKQLKSDAYQVERDEIKKIIDAGVDEQLFFDAYFESRDTKTPPKERAPALRALLRRINEVYPGETSHLMKIEKELEEKNS